MSAAAGGAAAAASVASQERVEPIVYSATMIGSTYWPSTVVAIAAASEIASTANGQRRRTSNGSVAASTKASPARTLSCSIPLANVVPTTGTPTATVIATSTMRGDGSPSHLRRAEETRSAYPRPGGAWT